MAQDLLQERLNAFLALSSQLEDVLTQETQIIKEMVKEGIWEQRSDRQHLTQKKEQLSNRYESLFKAWRNDFQEKLDAGQREVLRHALRRLETVCTENQGALQGVYILGQRFLSALRQHVGQRSKATTYSQNGYVNSGKRRTYAGQITNPDLSESSVNISL